MGTGSTKAMESDDESSMESGKKDHPGATYRP
jgi:hypothetical protein